MVDYKHAGRCTACESHSRLLSLLSLIVCLVVLVAGWHYLPGAKTVDDVLGIDQEDLIVAGVEQ